MTPVALFTKSVTVLRTYLALLAGLAMFVSFLPWLAVFGRRPSTQYTVPLGAATFGLTWFAVYYGSAGYPNLWLAFALIAGIGYFLKAVQLRNSVGALVGAFVAFTSAAVFRPTDTIAAAAPIVLTLLIKQWRVPVAVGSVAAGVVAGSAPWIIEAFYRFGGPVERLRSGAGAADSEIRVRLIDQLYASDGPYLLCTGMLCTGVSLGIAIWWVGQFVLAVAAVVAARRQGLFLPALLTLSCAVSFAAPYFSVVGNSHPRFLVPAYAMLSIIAAHLMVTTFAMVTSSLRRYVTVAVAASLLALAAVHGHALLRVLRIQVAASDGVRERIVSLAESGQLRAPCLLYGEYTVVLSYHFGCDRLQTDVPPDPNNRAVQDALAAGKQVVLVFDADVRLTEPYSGWQRLQLQPKRDLYAYLSPR